MVQELANGPSGKKEIIGIQYLRGIAAIAVVVDHVAGMASFAKYFGKDPWSKEFLAHGAMGVDLFFMISGFIIATVSLDPITIKPRVDIKTFLLRRSIRIIPIMWVAIVSYFALRFLGRGTDSILSYLRALVLFPVGTVSPANIWTLRHEVLFYALFAATFLNRGTLGILLISWFVAPIVVSVLPLPKELLGEIFHFIFHPANMLFGFGFAIGLMTLRFSRQPIRMTSPMIVRYFMLVYFVAMMYIGAAMDLQLDRLPDTIISGALFTPLLLGAIYIQTDQSSVGLFLGDASYSIYLFHPHFASALLGVLARVEPQLDVNIVVVLTVLMSLACCCVVYILLERPMLAELKARFAGYRPAWAA